MTTRPAPRRAPDLCVTAGVCRGGRRRKAFRRSCEAMKRRCARSSARAPRPIARPAALRRVLEQQRRRDARDEPRRETPRHDGRSDRASAATPRDRPPSPRRISTARSNSGRRREAGAARGTRSLPRQWEARRRVRPHGEHPREGDHPNIGDVPGLYPCAPRICLRPIRPVRPPPLGEAPSRRQPRRAPAPDASASRCRRTYT